MIIIADVHLGKVNDSIYREGVPSQTADIVTRLDLVLDVAVSTGQSIIVAGDIFNRVNPPTSVIFVWFSWLSRCKDAGVRVYLIGGNHDAGVDWMNLSMVHAADFPNVTVCESPNQVKVSENGVDQAVVLWPHIPLAWREAMEESGNTLSEMVAHIFPDAEFVVTHGQVVESAYSNDIFFEAGDAMEIDPKPFKKAKLIAAGHIHGHGTYAVDGGLVVYPGSLTINNFGEVDELKGYLEVTPGTLEYRWVEFPEDGVTPWRHVEIDLTEKDETSIRPEDVEGIASGAVVKITIRAKQYGVVNEVYIRDLFNKYGKVTRFETVVVGEDAAVAYDGNRKSHRELLKDHLDSADATEAERALALKIGSRIISEVSA